MAKKTKKIETYKLYNDKVKLTYEDKRHIYKASRKKGKKWTKPEIVYGVTSITGVISKPSLVNWAVKLTKEKTKDLIRSNGWGEFSKKLDEFLYKAGGEHYRASKEARELGTRVHEMAEEWLTKGSNKIELTKKMLEAESADERNCYKALLQFFNEYDIEPIELEGKCYSKKYGYAGTIDVLGKVKKKTETKKMLVVLDYKTSSAIYDGYPLQTTAYAQAKKEEGLDIKQTMIVRLGKDGKLEVKTTKDWEKYLEPFLGALKLKEYLMEFKAENFDKSNK